jgi:predicted phosphohydrolase
MTIQYASDLHLEFPRNQAFLKAHPLSAQAALLILAGDIVPFAMMDKHRDFFQYLSDHFEAAYWLPGNHEYYHFDLAEKCGVLDERIRPNVRLVNNLAVTIGEARFLFTTLWAKISPANQWLLERNVSDFRAIRDGGYRLSAERFNALHEESLRFLTAELQHPVAAKTVVATHHVPTLLHYPAQYKDSLLNEAFAVELHELIDETGPDCWIYGHHHSNTPEFRLGRTRMLTNQLGYVHLMENRGFERGAVVEL